jgi:hypothetical protein
MKKIIVFALLFTSMMTYAATKVEVYYFHYSRRCTTCNAVEEVTKKTISESFTSQFKKREITFKSINLDEDKNATLAKKCKVEGQALLVMGNGKRIDLTDKAFMYARTSPEKLKAELKKAIDALL